MGSRWLSQTSKVEFVETETVYHCPVKQCERTASRSKRGCRQHVCTHHGWYYYVDSEQSIRDAFPEDTTCELSEKSSTQKVPNIRIQWYTVLTVVHMQEARFWGISQEMDQVVSIPHGAKHLLDTCKHIQQISANDLTFSTAFVTTLLFLQVKATRPMAYQYLTTDQCHTNT